MQLQQQRGAALSGLEACTDTIVTSMCTFTVGSSGRILPGLSRSKRLEARVAKSTCVDIVYAILGRGEGQDK